jgi:hypothetical protein
MSMFGRLAVIHEAGRDVRLTPTALRVLIQLDWRLMSPDRRCVWPKQKTLAKELGTTRENINRAIQDLTKYHYLIARDADCPCGGQNEHGAHHYQLRMPGWPDPSFYTCRPEQVAGPNSAILATELCDEKITPPVMKPSHPCDETITPPCDPGITPPVMKPSHRRIRSEYREVVTTPGTPEPTETSSPPVPPSPVDLQLASQVSDTCAVQPESITAGGNGLKPFEADPEVDEAWDYYRAKIQPHAKVVDRAKVKKRLKTFGLDLIKQAIDHFAANSWQMEHNAHRGADWWFKSDARVESYINLRPRSGQTQHERTMARQSTPESINRQTSQEKLARGEIPRW